MATIESLPDEILRIIAQLVYLDHLPRSLFRCIDPHGLPSTYPNGKLISSTQQITQYTLHSLCLTNRRLYYAAKPLLWRRLQITLPYSFLLLLRSLGASKLAEAYEEQHRLENEEGFTEGKLNAQMNVNSMIAAVGLARATGQSLYVSEKLDNFDTSTSSAQEPMDLVWIEDLHDGRVPQKHRYQVTFRHDDSDMSDVHRYPRVLDFSTFRTQGMRRTVGEGQDSRFITPSRLLALITATSSGLMAFGACSTMDSALSLEVLEALLFRDGDMEVSTHKHLRGVSIERSRERGYRKPRRLESLDLCNCVSRYFEAALTRFVEKHLRKFSGRMTSTVQEEEDTEESSEERLDSAVDERRGRARSRGRDVSQTRTISRSISVQRSDSGAPSKHPARATVFPSVQRLCLAGIHFAADLLNPFVMAFPRLTHLDLSGTKADNALLQALSASQDLELESLSLARCTRFTSETLTELLVDSPACASLLELSIEGTLLFPTAITRTDLETVITTAPFMRSGTLRYLDLGACGMDDALLGLFPKQPSLLDLGLNSSPQLTLSGVAQFLLKRAPNVQVLELVDSCQSTGPLNIVQLNTQLLEPCSTIPPMTISEQLAAMGFGRSLNNEDGQNSISNRPAVKEIQAKTNLRVVGLSIPVLKKIQGALGNWNPILGAGRRGWLVDVSSGPDPEAIDEDISQADVVAEESIFSPVVPSKRGRSNREYAPLGGAWEPETPPRRLSRSPSVNRAKDLRSSLMSRRPGSDASPRGSRSRSRHLLSPPRSTSTLLHQEEHHDKTPEEERNMKPRAEVIRALAKDHPRRLHLEKLARANGYVTGSTGWHSRKMEVLLGMGMLGRESGSYAYSAYQT